MVGCWEHRRRNRNDCGTWVRWPSRRRANWAVSRGPENDRAKPPGRAATDGLYLCLVLRAYSEKGNEHRSPQIEVPCFHAERRRGYRWFSSAFADASTRRSGRVVYSTLGGRPRSYGDGQGLCFSIGTRIKLDGGQDGRNAHRHLLLAGCQLY